MRPFDAQDGLYSVLQAAGLTGWTLDLGLPPIRDELHAWVHDDVQDWTADDEVTGMVSQRERFQLSVYLFSRRLDSTFEEQRDELKAAADKIRTQLIANPTLGGNVDRARFVGGAYEGAFESETGKVRIGVLRMDVDCDCW